MFIVPPADQDPEADPPFLIEHLRRDETPTHFIPAARLIVTPELRRSGLLRALNDEAVRSLLAVLTFLTPNGQIRPTAAQVAEVLGVSVGSAERRLRRLTAQ